jgi:hypothetical protein
LREYPKTLTPQDQLTFKYFFVNTLVHGAINQLFKVFAAQFALSCHLSEIGWGNFTMTASMACFCPHGSFFTILQVVNKLAVVILTFPESLFYKRPFNLIPFAGIHIDSSLCTILTTRRLSCFASSLI